MGEEVALSGDSDRGASSGVHLGVDDDEGWVKVGASGVQHGVDGEGRGVKVEVGYIQHGPDV